MSMLIKILIADRRGCFRCEDYLKVCKCVAVSINNDKS